MFIFVLIPSGNDIDYIFIGNPRIKMKLIRFDFEIWEEEEYKHKLELIPYPLA